MFSLATALEEHRQETLLSVMDAAFKEIRFDKHLSDLLYHYQVGFVNKNSDHLHFFTGNLLGVEPIRFTDRDFHRFFSDVVDIDVEQLRRQIGQVEAIIPTRKVSSDVFNLVCFYLMHRFLKADHKLITPKLIERTVIDTALIFNYRTITSLVSYYFRYPADPKVAQATYAALSNRYLIKKLGSWQQVFYYRSQEIIGPDSLHRKTIEEFTDDYGIVYAINDAQGRIRDMVKNIYAEFIKIHRGGQGIHTTTGTLVDLEGEEVIKDKTEGITIYIQHLLMILPDTYSFIRKDYLDIVKGFMPMVPIAHLETTLTWLSKNIIGAHAKNIEDYIRMVLVYAIDYLFEEGWLPRKHKDYGVILSRLKGAFLSSRSSDPMLMSIRDQGDLLVEQAIGRINRQTAISVRNTLVLYLCLRAFSSDKH